MKILATIVIPPHLNTSGAVNAALYLSRAVAEYCQVDIALMASEDAKEEFGQATLLKMKSRNVLSFTRKFLPDKFRTLFYQADIPELITKGDYDLIHIHNPIPALEMRRIAQSSLNKGIPYVVSTHGFVEMLDKERAYSLRWHEKIAGKFLLDIPLKYVIDHASKIFGLTPFDIPLLQLLGIVEQKVVIVPNGVNELYYEPPTEQEIQQVRQKFALEKAVKSKIPVCIFLGNHTKNKGLDVLFAAFSQTKKPYCLIVGGKKREYPYAQFVAQCGPDQRIIITDLLTEKEIRALFHLSDLFVFPTLADTMPLVILEAMAAGLPILSTKVGGIPHQVSDSSGLLVEPGDPTALREGFEALTTEPFRLRTMGQSARTNVKSRFDWNRSATIAYAEYCKVLQ